MFLLLVQDLRNPREMGIWGYGDDGEMGRWGEFRVSGSKPYEIRYNGMLLHPLRRYYYADIRDAIGCVSNRHLRSHVKISRTNFI